MWSGSRGQQESKQTTVRSARVKDLTLHIEWADWISPLAASRFCVGCLATRVQSLCAWLLAESLEAERHHGVTQDFSPCSSPSLASGLARANRPSCAQLFNPHHSCLASLPGWEHEMKRHECPMPSLLHGGRRHSGWEHRLWDGKFGFRSQLCHLKPCEAARCGLCAQPIFIPHAREAPGEISTKGVDSAPPEPRGRERGSSSLRPLRRATTEARVGASEQEQDMAEPMGGDPLSPGKGKPAWKPTLLCPKNTWA